MTTVPQTLLEVMTALKSWDPTRQATLPRFKISFLRNYSLENAEPYLKLAALQSGHNAEIQFGNYDSIRQDLLSSENRRDLGAQDLVILSLQLPNLIPRFLANEWNASTYVSEIQELSSLCREAGLRKVAVTSFVLPFYSELGPALPADGRDLTAKVETLNLALRQICLEHPETFIYLDWNRIVRQLGHQETIDTRYWYMSQAPFRPAFLSRAMGELGGVIRALRGLTKKCLVLDCDNTLWGGVIGEDGMSGIKLGPETDKGRAFFDFQCSVKALKNRGVILAVCSKNNPEDALEVFDSHPHQVLRREDFSGWRINWSDKSQNITELAQELNLGLNSFVFVDDSPVECERMRIEQPEVTVLQVPEKLHTLPDLIWKSGLFDTLRVSGEDLSRTEMYREQAAREKQKTSFASIDEYLASLEQVATIHPLTATELTRATQLTQKTNQFNFTTKRYLEKDIEQMSQSPEYLPLTLSVKDRHGDSGLTGLMILKKENEVCVLDTFLMSCRILSRRLEFAFLNQALTLAQTNWGTTHFRAWYFPTAKNVQVADFWDNVGMALTEEQNGSKQYEIPIHLIKYPSLDFIAVKE